MLKSLFSIFRSCFLRILFNLAGFLIICTTSFLRAFSALLFSFSSRRSFFCSLSRRLSSLMVADSSLIALMSLLFCSFFAKVGLWMDCLIRENLKQNRGCKFFRKPFPTRFAEHSLRSRCVEDAAALCLSPGYGLLPLHHCLGLRVTRFRHRKQSNAG